MFFRKSVAYQINPLCITHLSFFFRIFYIPFFMPCNCITLIIYGERRGRKKYKQEHQGTRKKEAKFSVGFIKQKEAGALFSVDSSLFSFLFVSSGKLLVFLRQLGKCEKWCSSLLRGIKPKKFYRRKIKPL